MQIKRDYSEPFFGARRRRRSLVRPLILFGLLIGALLLVVYNQFDQLQHMALEMVGMAPTPTALPSELATQGTELARFGDLEGAAILFEQIIQQRPNDVNYLVEYGAILIELDEVDQALALAERALELAASDPRGYALKGRALVWSGSATAAIPVALDGLEIDPNYAPLLATLARAYADTGRWGEALDYGERAVQLDPSDADNHRSYAYTLTWVGETELAIDELQQAIALNPNLVNPYFELALQYLALNLDQEAIDTYDHILSLQPRNAKALLRQCEAYRKVGQFERAVGYCEDAVTADPDYTPAHFQLGMLRYNQRDFAAALVSFDQCVSNDVGQIECQYRRGLSHYYLGDCDTGWDILQTSLAMAQGRTGVETVIDNIRQGMTEIINHCAGYAGRAVDGDG